MKLTTLAIPALQATGILAKAVFQPSPADIAECGELGVADWSTVNIPPNIDQNNLRKCRKHPVEISRKSEKRADTHTLDKRACWYGPWVGCSYDGWCWERCNGDSGAWCWVADNGGWGPWTKCKTDAQCNHEWTMEGAGCGQGCAAGDTACGCDCRDKRD